MLKNELNSSPRKAAQTTFFRGKQRLSHNLSDEQIGAT